MTVNEILSNEELRRHEFPVACGKIFLAHAGVSPLPRRVSDAIRDYALQCALHDQWSLLGESLPRQTRQLAARLIGAQPEEIAFAAPTSLALSLAAAGLPWRKGDNILIYFDDYPANVYPWMALAEKGVQVRLMNLRELGKIRPVDVIGQVDEQTRLVALATNHFLAGFRPDLDAIGSALHQRNILFGLDAIQTLGAFPLSVRHVDFLAAGAHKWLLGPCGAGIFYVRKSLQDKLRPSVLGSSNVRSPNYVAQERMVFVPDARRYEPGTGNLIGLVGLRAALDLLLETGVENIAAELLRKRAWLLPALLEKGWSVLQADAPPLNASGIITIYRQRAEETDLAALFQKLRAAGIEMSLRQDRGGRQYLRISAHFYNTDEELRRTLELL
ncbi:MAG: aminotransferase class V-fold PLP-dependent enzyme [Verrucomicrobiota bacterium]|jgi:selenocysteine lyase/cysteine desulfurase